MAFSAFVFAWLVFAAPMQSRTEMDALYDTQNQRIEAGMAELKRIDDDLLDMQKHVAALEGSALVRKQQVRSLRLRHPSIVVADDADAQTIYTSLFSVRRQLAAQIRPILAATQDYNHRQSCTATQGAQKSRYSVENSPGFLALPLNERIAWKEAYDGLMKEGSSGRSCRPEDYLPTEPATASSLARAEQRYRESQDRLRRLTELNRRP